MSKYYKGLDLSNELQTMYEIILKVNNEKMRNELMIQLSNINFALDTKSNVIKSIIDKLNDL